MRILVVGATGGTGREVVRLGREAGHEMVAMVRQPVGGEANSFADAFVADVLEPEQVAKAVVGVDAVISCLGVKLGQEVGLVRSQGTANLVRAMLTEGPARLVAVSSVGVGSSIQAQGWFARRAWPRLVGRDRLDEARRAEEVVTSSGLEWTVVRPPRLTDRESTGSLVGEDLQTGMQSTLSRCDLAEVLVRSATRGEWSGRCITAVSR